MKTIGTVLVTDADRGSAVTIIRSLGRRGWRVIAADSRSRALGFCSRYARDRLVYPEPETAADRFIDTIHRTVVDCRVDLVIPVTDEVIHPLVHGRRRFEGVCRLALPETASLEHATDKSKTLALSESLGVPVPRTVVVRTVAEAREASNALGWPVVVKPAVSRRFDAERGVVEKYSVTYASTLEELLERVGALGDGSTILLQEYCEGTGYGVEMLAYEGRVVAAFQHKRLAEVPLTGGVSAWRESDPLDAELYRHSSRLVAALRWTGLIMVEFKVGSGVGARLMEINGRIWGSLPLAVLSGVDFPALLADLYLRGPTRTEEWPLVDYRTGLRVCNLELILKWIARVLLGRKPYPFLPNPQRRQALAAAFGLLSPGQRTDLSSRDDRRPAIAEVFKIARKVGAGIRARRCAPVTAVAALEGLRARPLYKTLDAVVTARIRPRQRCLDYLGCIISPRSSRFDRVAALVGLVETVLPGTERRAVKLLLRPDAIPFASSSVDLLSYGSGSTVFVLHLAHGRSVLKAYRRTIGQRRDILLRLAAEFRRKYETVSSWYHDQHDVVVRAHFLVLHGPMLRRPAVACVQRYLDGEKRDLFRDFDDDDLIRLASECPILKEQLVFFARRTIEIYERERRCPDILGAENLLLVREGDSIRLRLIDSGILDIGALKSQSPGTVARLADRISRLRSLLDAMAPRAKSPAARSGVQASPEGI